MGRSPRDRGTFTAAQFSAAARLLRALHDATLDCALRQSSEVVCHGDLSPCNCACGNGIRCAFIDFDAAHPGSRRDDLGYGAWLWLDIGNADIAAESQGRRPASFCADNGVRAGPAAVRVPARKARRARTRRATYGNPFYCWLA